MKKFRAKWGDRIEEIEIVKETDKQVIFINSNGRENREAKNSNWATWHNSKEEAKQYLISEQENKIEEKLRQIKSCKELIEKIKSL